MKARLISIDVLKGFSIMVIILGRFFNEWMDWTPRDYTFFKEFILFFANTATTFFLILSGMGYHFFINNRINKIISKSKIFVEVIKRSLFIFCISTLIQILLGFIFDMKISNIIYWSIFQVVAFSMILFFSLQFLKQKMKRILYLSLIILLFLLDFVISHYKITYLSILVDGTFPFIPWVNLYIFGLLFGDMISNWSRDQFSKKMKMYCTIGIVDIIIFSLWLFLYLHTWYHYPQFLPFYMLNIGIFIMLFVLCYYYFDIKSKEIYFQNSIILWGKLIFSMYYINWGVVAIGLLVFPLIFNEIYYSGFLIYQYIILMIVIFVFLEFFIRIWQKINFFLGVEWLMNRVSKRTLFLKGIEKEGIYSNGNKQ